MAGPTGSGKGYIINNVIHYLKGNSNNIRMALIDDYIECDPEYIKESLKITIGLKDLLLINYNLPLLQQINELFLFRNDNNDQIDSIAKKY